LKPADFLNIAKGLVGIKDSEAAYRSATSRAYYASYHEALDVAVKQGFNSPTEFSCHGQLAVHFAQRGGVHERGISSQLSSLRRKRNRSDYNLDMNVTELAARSSIEDAEDILELCRIVRD